MKTYKDIYKFPLHTSKYGGWVYDAENNFVFQFEPYYNKEGQYRKGYLDFVKNVIKKLNGEEHKFESTFSSNKGEIFYKGLHIITIRGWGNLTGVGSHNLPAEEAANIQDTFEQFIIETLNKNPQK